MKILQLLLETMFISVHMSVLLKMCILGIIALLEPVL